MSRFRIPGHNACVDHGLVMSIGNQEFGIPTKKISIPNRYLVFMSQISWYFLGILSVILITVLLKFGLILVFFGRIKIGLVFVFCGCHFLGIGLVSVCHFPENGISTMDVTSQYLSMSISPRKCRKSQVSGVETVRNANFA